MHTAKLAMQPSGSIYSFSEFAFYKFANSFIEADVDDADVSKIDVRWRIDYATNSFSENLF